jgi:galactonate dehydratase
MKIQSIDTYAASDGRNNAIYVVITTESGLVGYGEAYPAGPDLAVVETIKYLADWIIGQDASRRERIWAECFRGLRFPAGAVGWSAISGIDLALWDLAGKAANQPVYKLLGGAFRDRVWVYKDIVTGEPAFMADQVRKHCEQDGFTAFKIFPFATEDDELPWNRILRLVESRTAAVRDAGGDDIEIGIDFHAKLEEPFRVAEMADVVQPFRPFFIEEPIRPGSHAVMAEARARMQSPLATGESLYGKHEFQALIDAKGVDILQPDILLCGGMTELRKIAAFAEAHMISVAPHNPFGTLGALMTAHFGLATQNFLIMELGADKPDGSDDILSLRGSFIEADLQIKDGYVSISDAPGWGASVNLEQVKKYEYKHWRRPVPRRHDGGFGYY